MSAQAQTDASFFPKARVEAYTDGVFAIAATLLVLDLTTAAFGRVDTDAELWAAIGGLGDNIVSFVVSFLLLSMLWVIHLDQFRGIARADGVLLWINNIRLLFIVLIPFTTSLVSEYSAYYAGRMLLPINFFLAALLGYLTWAWAASRNGHLLTDAAKLTTREDNIGALTAVVAGAAAAALSPWIGSWAFLTFALNGPVTVWLQRRARASGPSTPG